MISTIICRGAVWTFLSVLCPSIFVFGLVLLSLFGDWVCLAYRGVDSQRRDHGGIVGEHGVFILLALLILGQGMWLLGLLGFCLTKAVGNGLALGYLVVGAHKVPVVGGLLWYDMMQCRCLSHCAILVHIGVVPVGHTSKAVRQASTHDQYVAVAIYSWDRVCV